MTPRTLLPWLDDRVNNTTPITPRTLPPWADEIINSTTPPKPVVPVSTTSPPIPSTTTPSVIIERIPVNNNNDNDTLILIWSVSLLVLTLVTLFVYIRHTSYNRKLKNLELQHKIETEKYKLEVLEKSKIDNVHVEEMEKINFSLLKETRDYEYTQLQDERGFILAQQKIDAQNGKNILDAVMPLIAQQNNHQINLAKVKGSLDQIFEDDNIANLNNKKK